MSKPSLSGSEAELEWKPSFYSAAFRSVSAEKQQPSNESQPLLQNNGARGSTDDTNCCKNLANLPCRQATKGVQWISMLQKNYGAKLLIALIIVQHLTKGFVMSWIGNALNYYFRDLGGINSSTIQTYTAVISTPWCLKGILGLISDTVTVFGYHKGPWITLSTIGFVCAGIYVGLSPVKTIKLQNAIACLLLMQLHIAWSDLLTEAKYSEKIRQKPAHGSDLISFVWGGLSIAQLLAVATVGQLIEHLGAKYVFALSVIPCALGIFPGSLNLLEEDPQHVRAQQQALIHPNGDGMGPGLEAQGNEQLAHAGSLWSCFGFITINTSKICKHSNYFVLVLILTGLSLVLAVVGAVSTNNSLNCTIAIGAGLVTFIAFFVLADPLVAKTNSFFLLYACCYISIEGATFYFFTDTPEQYPGGPNFSPTFYTTVIGLIASGTSLLGIYIYNAFLSHSKYRTIFLINGLMWTLINIISCAVFLRWNLLVGIPDEVFVLGSQALQQMILQFGWIPGVVLMSHLCHEGMEATMYALMAGSQNMGSNISYFTGAYILEVLKVQPSGAKNESHQFDNLWLVAVISSLGGLVPLLFLPYLIPDARPDEKLVHVR
mmetsp:Transcript_22348/g.31292  ORF Transcript_22348/g.31292 Transcript_22348/m.31292 type:complete len:604 (-) Transcript_22348:157-1968(-)|eukprot:CAMPEP_0184483748 /NCGR_PEP_ID=MMETSP0113_2-20130426/5425_1 /TAXON_ID=91329 /ORGANISM="Norrisiella sphaerica, Strain BC52" /LENGTH=603 /DNA_ID=CAMNT_0026864337 /DNA_START=160 /DNA_END=1971 /DNA_ORIENTATION=-